MNIEALTQICKAINTNENYRNKPPKGPPPSLPVLSKDANDALNANFLGRDLGMSDYAYESIKLNIEGDMQLKQVNSPTKEDLKDLNLWAIDGSNQRVDFTAFSLILTKATLINFRYSIPGYKPYFYTKSKEASGIVWVDGNIFNEEVSLHANTTGYTPEETRPYLYRYDPAQNQKPNSYTLGLAVQLQQQLELSMLDKIPRDVEGVCIRDGPLFATSAEQIITSEKLEALKSWQNGVLIACSKRVKESTLLIETLMGSSELRDYWFKGQSLTKETLKSVATDSLILQRILKPGERTPFIEAIPRARANLVREHPDLTPLACYYFSRHRPHTYIRMEIPRFMWGRDKERVNRAVEIVAWQHELGHKAPLIQLAADERCQLGPEKHVITRQIKAYLDKNNIILPEGYDDA